MKFKISTLEQTQSRAVYIVEAETLEEAKDKVYCHDLEPCKAREPYNFELEIEKIEEVTP